MRVKTTSHNPALRFFLLGLALLLVNIWAFLRWFVARVASRGPHRLHPTRFQFQAFVAMFRRSTEMFYGAVMDIPMPVLSMKSWPTEFVTFGFIHGVASHLGERLMNDDSPGYP